MTRIVLENRFEFCDLGDGASSSSSSSTNLSPPSSLDEHVDIGAPHVERGDRLSPISRKAPRDEAPTKAPSHHRGDSGPTTPRPTPSTPTTRRAVPVAAPSRKDGSPSGGAHDFSRGVTARLPDAAAPREIGPHDFARGLAPRGSAPTVPPHAQRALGRSRNRIMHRSDAPLAPPPGHGHNAVMRRGAGSLAATAAPKGAAFTRHIYEAARRAGIPETQARLAAAQAAHESDYGRRAPGHNYFGVKGSGTAGSQMLRTHEQGPRGLYATRGRFARYAAPEDSLKHWWAKIQRQWPQAAGAQNFDEAVQGLRAGRRGGYATDACYNEKLRRIAATLARPSTGSSPKAIAGARTPQGPVPPTSTAGR